MIHFVDDVSKKRKKEKRNCLVQTGKIFQVIAIEYLSLMVQDLKIQKLY